MQSKKESLIIVFYVMYFSWLFAIVFLTQDLKILNLFAILTVIFYFIFLKTRGDFLFFLIGFLIPILVSAITLSKSQENFNFSFVLEIPIWLPLAWGTTVIALKRFLKIIKQENL